MTNPQGTQWESTLVGYCEALHIPADRYPKRGEKHEPDVYIGRANDPFTIPIVSWKRLTKSNPDSKRRTPDGERDVVVMGTQDFLAIVNMLYAAYPMDSIPSFDVQSKWTQNLNVTRILGGLRTWLKERRDGYASLTR